MRCITCKKWRDYKQEGTRIQAKDTMSGTTNQEELSQEWKRGRGTEREKCQGYNVLYNQPGGVEAGKRQGRRQKYGCSGDNVWNNQPGEVEEFRLDGGKEAHHPHLQPHGVGQVQGQHQGGTNHQPQHPQGHQEREIKLWLQQALIAWQDLFPWHHQVFEQSGLVSP